VGRQVAAALRLHPQPYSFSKFSSEVIGNEYLVLGTIERRVWQKGVKGEETEVGEVLKHVADFKKVYDLEYDPGG
jgi:hypothetical protein